MNYVDFINKLLREKVIEEKHIVLFGQNIVAGSCISGLGRGLKVKEGNLILNTPNCENTMTGVGFGLMLNGVSSVMILKQQDFLLLGIDHLVNTYNFIRREKPKASFTILTPVIDNGYQGLQSSFNNFADICSIARVDGYAVTNRIDIDEIIQKNLTKPGFRIIGVSQRLWRDELLDPPFIRTDGNVFTYVQGEDVTIVCFNFSFPQGFELYNKMKSELLSPSLFSVSKMTPVSWKNIIEDVKRTKKLIILDDSKSENIAAHSLLADVLANVDVKEHILVRRDFSEDWLSPQEDKLVVDFEKIINKIKN